METKIQGIPIAFPYKPYPSQLSMMNRIIQSLVKEQNCLLESPTGSGKSLALLCSSLAWVKKLQEENQALAKHEMDETDLEDCCPECEEYSKTLSRTFGSDEKDDFIEDEKLSKKIPCGKCECHQLAQMEKMSDTKRVPKIFYGTRTHKQITQLTREMRKTKYSSMNMTILSSRNHSCINSRILHEHNRNEACRELIKDNACSFYNNVRKANKPSIIKDLGLADAWDIEDLVEALKEVGACPYYTARELVNTADIVFCPYSYLLDPIFRDAVNLNLNGAVIILDEAHNIEDAAREAASFTITEEQLKVALANLDSLVTREVEVHHTLPLKEMIVSTLRLMDLTKSRMLRSGDDGGQDGVSHVWTGLEIVSLLKEIGIGPDRLIAMKKHFTAVMEEQNKENNENKRPARKRAKEDDKKLTPPTINLFESLFCVLNFIFKENFKYRDDYRVALTQTTTFTRKPAENENDAENKGGMDGWLSKHRTRKSFGKGNLRPEETISLNFWCLNSAVVFEELGRMTHSVILTSGTLAPLVSFESELGVDFPVKLEANHVIKPDQIFVATIGEGPSGGELYATFRNYETYRFQDELGDLVVRSCEVVPHGVLCFLPSYTLMDKLVQRWESTGLTKRISAIKRLMMEPRHAVNFEEWMRRFEGEIASSVSGPNAEGQTGVLLLAVCRGKVSEGLDFADHHARMVITVGIPFPNFKDTQVRLKKAYNDSTPPSPAVSNEEGASSSTATPRQLLSGNEWYEVQAYRALNQALGRCIRHRSDWGALILVDARFGRQPSRYISGVSKWVRDRVVHLNRCSQLFDGLRHFVQRRTEEDKMEAQLDESCRDLETSHQTKHREHIPVRYEDGPEITSSPPQNVKPVKADPEVIIIDSD